MKFKFVLGVGTSLLTFGIASFLCMMGKFSISPLTQAFQTFVLPASRTLLPQFLMWASPVLRPHFRDRGGSFLFTPWYSILTIVLLCFLGIGVAHIYLSLP